MNFIKKIGIGLLLLLEVNYSSAQEAFTIAREQFDKFNNVEGGWLASDATISLLLPDGKTLWLFGDCFIGEKSGDFGINKASSTFINNAAIIEDENSLTTYHGGTVEAPESLIPSINGDIFWPEHATIENDTIKIFVIQIIEDDNGIPGFNFRIGRTHLASFTYPEMEYIKTEVIEDITDPTMRFGTHVLKREDYTYIFGKKDTTINGFSYPIPMLARVKESVNEPWEFYAGSDIWSYDCENAKPIGDRPMSESFFVYEKNDKFYLIMHEIWMVGELYILESDKITGPWNRSFTGGKENLFCKIPKQGTNFTYNLFAHPQFEKEGKILISFNVNTSDFNSIYTDTRNYRARFLWLSVEDAITTTNPGTVIIYDDFVDIPLSETLNNNLEEDDFITFQANSILIKNMETPSIVSVYSIDGKLLFYQKISNELKLNLNAFPNKVLLIRLINNKTVISKKIINTH